MRSFDFDCYDRIGRGTVPGRDIKETSKIAISRSFFDLRRCYARTTCNYLVEMQLNHCDWAEKLTLIIILRGVFCDFLGDP